MIDWERIQVLMRSGTLCDRQNVQAASTQVRERYRLPDGRYLDVRIERKEKEIEYLDYAIRNYPAHCWVV